MSELTRHEINARLTNLFDEDDLNPVRTAYREAAATLSFFTLESLAPVGTPRDIRVAVEFSQDCEPTRDEASQPAWTLKRHHRVRILRDLLTNNRFTEARSANTSHGRVQDALDAAVSGRFDVGRDLPTLRAQITVAGWLEGVIPMPGVKNLKAEYERLQLLEPFHHLVGDGFGGRTAEYRTLSNYAGYYEAEGLREYVRRGYEQVRSITERPPLFIHGPGGVGKSTLIARFILVHTIDVPPEDRFPFVYLDFDRTALTAEEPVTLLLEAIRQIGHQYPEVADESESLYRHWRERMKRVDVEKPSGAGRPSFRLRNRDYYLSSFADFVNRLKQQQQPLILVLDTFEEVQFRQPTYISEVFRVLDDLQRRVPRTRVILAGRDLPDVRLDKKPVRLQPLVLGEFDQEAALAYLRNYGVSPAEDAEEIIAQVGRAPLVLKVAVQLWKLEPGDLQGLDTSIWARLKGKTIETQLYTRILDHIHHDDVRRLAHPGLVLRRITAPLIREVLAEVCEVPVPTPERARELLEQLRAEFTLVTPDPQDPDAVVHRPDVRTLMLAAIKSDEPDRVRRIHELAAEYYERQAEERARAEALYHRLSLGVDRSQLGIIDLTGFETALPGSAIRELPPESQAFLAARIPITVPDSVWKHGSQEDWTAYAVRRLRDCLRADDWQSALRATQPPAAGLASKIVDRLRALLQANMEKPDLSAGDLMKLHDAIEVSLKGSQWLRLVRARGIAVDDSATMLESLLTANSAQQMAGLTGGLLNALPDNATVYTIAGRLGLASLNDRVLDDVANTMGDRTILDVTSWRQRFGRLERSICRVEHAGMITTGALVGRGLVLVPWPALEAMLAQKSRRPPQFRFDYRGDDSPGFALSLDAGKILCRDDHLQFALVHLEEASDRDWLGVREQVSAHGSGLFLLQYRQGTTLQLGVDEQGVLDVDDDFVYYGSSAFRGPGGVCFNDQFEMVALHLGIRDGRGFGAHLSAIKRALANIHIRVPEWEPSER